MHFLQNNPTFGENILAMNIRFFLTVVLLSTSFLVFSSPHYINYQANDTSIQLMTDSLNSVLNFQSDYLSNAEVEHQKLMRNIFAISFILMLALLVFTIIFYGRKIKKVSGIIVMQNEVLTSTKDQLIKIINIFNYIDRQVYITDSKGNIEWHNSHASNWFIQDYDKEKISLINKFANENKGLILQGINDVKIITFEDNVFDQQSNWKMIPIKNSKDEFSNMVFIGSDV